MVLSSSSSAVAQSPHHSYSRKQKSLGVLCTNFVSLYSRYGVDLVGLDDAANRLGVERRRIYDIVNVLESVGLLERKAKNQYTWKGFGAIPRALLQLKEEGLRSISSSFDGSNCAKVLYDDEDEDNDDEDDERFFNPNTGIQNDKSNPSSVLKPSASSKLDNRREKSLGFLTQNFVKLFLCSNMELISLDDAARLLLGDGHNASTMNSKVRRLYDIANVLSSMNLIEKTHITESRKPAFRWLGLQGKSEDRFANSSDPNETRKRIFGTDVTNISSKRTRLDSSDENLNQNIKMQMQLKQESLDEVDRSHLEQDSKRSVNNYNFGPFAPVSVPKVCVSENNNVKPDYDWESLACTYRPQYHNQVLRDLFGHYTEAWKSWYSEVADFGRFPQFATPDELL